MGGPLKLNARDLRCAWGYTGSCSETEYFSAA